MNVQLTDEAVVGIGAAIAVVLGIAFLLLWAKLRKLQKRMSRIIGNASVENVDDLLLQIQERMEQLQAGSLEQQERTNAILNKIKKMKSNVRMIRYNAFQKESGSDLSFSLAFTDEEQNGVVLTGIHSREETYMYAKPVENGQSKYTLSPEEKLVISPAAIK